MEADRERGGALRRKRELAYEGTTLEVYRDLVTANGREESWDFIHHGGVIAVVPVLLSRGIPMVRQYRNTLGRFTLELPAGKVDNPEEPRALCAFREFSEGIGVRAESPEAFEFPLRIDATVALCDEGTDIFVAQNLLPGEQYLDPGEVINVQTYEFSELLARIERGEIRDAKTVARLTAYALKQSRSNRT